MKNQIIILNNQFFIHQFLNVIVEIDENTKEVLIEKDEIQALYILK